MNVESQQILEEKSSQCKLKMLVTADFFLLNDSMYVIDYCILLCLYAEPRKCYNFVTRL